MEWDINPDDAPESGNQTVESTSGSRGGSGGRSREPLFEEVGQLLGKALGDVVASHLENGAANYPEIFILSEDARRFVDDPELSEVYTNLSELDAEVLSLEDLTGANVGNADYFSGKPTDVAGDDVPPDVAMWFAEDGEPADEDEWSSDFWAATDEAIAADREAPTWDDLSCKDRVLQEINRELRADPDFLHLAQQLAKKASGGPTYGELPEENAVVLRLGSGGKRHNHRAGTLGRRRKAKINLIAGEGTLDGRAGILKAQVDKGHRTETEADLIRAAVSEGVLSERQASVIPSDADELRELLEDNDVEIAEAVPADD